MCDTRNVANKMIKTALLAVSIFYSRIILRKLKHEELIIYKKIEKLMKICTNLIIVKQLKFIFNCDKETQYIIFNCNKHINIYKGIRITMNKLYNLVLNLLIT